MAAACRVASATAASLSKAVVPVRMVRTMGTMQDLQRRRRNRARLERVERVLRKWDAWDRAPLPPAGEPPAVRRPSLGRDALRSLRRMPLQVLAELELQWERRN